MTPANLQTVRDGGATFVTDSIVESLCVNAEPAVLLRAIRAATGDRTISVSWQGVTPDGADLWLVRSARTSAHLGTGPTDLDALRDAHARLEK